MARIALDEVNAETMLKTSTSVAFCNSDVESFSGLIYMTLVSLYFLVVFEPELFQFH